MYYFIINPQARTGLGAQIWRDVLAEIKRRRLVYEAFFTEHRGHAARFAKNPGGIISLSSAATVLSRRF